MWKSPNMQFSGEDDAVECVSTAFDSCKITDNSVQQWDTGVMLDESDMAGEYITSSGDRVIGDSDRDITSCASEYEMGLTGSEDFTKENCVNGRNGIIANCHTDIVSKESAIGSGEMLKEMLSNDSTDFPTNVVTKDIHPADNITTKVIIDDILKRGNHHSNQSSTFYSAKTGNEISSLSHNDNTSTSATSIARTPSAVSTAPNDCSRDYVPVITATAVDIGGTNAVETASLPDGGVRGWVVVAASFLLSLLQDGISQSFGVFLPSLALFYKTGRTEAALTNSILVMMLHVSGPLGAGIITRVGHRATSIIGIILAVSGFVTAGLVTLLVTDPPLPVLYLSIGVCSGLGFGFIYLAAMDIIKYHFDRNLGLATGLASAGSGVGQLVLAPSLQAINSNVGLGYTFLSIAAMMLSGLILSMLYVLPTVPSPREDDGVAPSCDNQIGKPKDADSSGAPTVQQQSPAKKARYQYLFARRLWREIRRILVPYCSLLKSPPLLILLFSMFLIGQSTFSAFYFTTDRAILMDIDDQSASWLLSIVGISSCVGKVVFGKLLDIYRERTFTLTTLVLAVNSCTIIFSGFLPTYTGQVLYSIVFGLSFGAYICSNYVVLVIIDKDKVTTMLGLILLAMGIASILSPLIVASLFDRYGSYFSGFVTVGCLGAGGAALTPFVYLLIPKPKNT